MSYSTTLLAGVLGADSLIQRRAISKAITLLESTRTDHRAQADELLTQLLPHTGKAFRLGISGVPGVGKSTFIEALGLYLIAQGLRVAVLAVDPSSSVSGGSILGDKTRMEHLSMNERAYIRPSPSSGTLGGVAEKTREAMLVCEAAGYDVVLVETVGVSTLAAGHKTLVPAIIAELKKQGAHEIIVFVGGVIPAQDYDFLYEAGVKGIYGPGTPIPASAKDVLEQIRKARV